MGLTVYAENMGFFHKGSGGKGIAPGDVCMTPPPPPAGPIPVPYVNIAQASDLTKGSKTVKIDGEPTALEDVSEVSTSSGNEPGSQPPKGVVTATNKGKASFTLWSFTVKVEGKGVCRHGDPMFQNEMSTPPNIVCMSAVVKANVELYTAMLAYAGKPCPPGREEPPPTKTTKSQREAVRGDGPCWSCGKKRNQGAWSNGKRYNRGKRWTADHQPPQSYVWKYLGGCHPEVEAEFEKWKASTKSVQPQCAGCSCSQGGSASSNDVTDFLTFMGI
jgi:uncharacterized Zn-binding protein involved in type VI secretion